MKTTPVWHLGIEHLDHGHASCSGRSLHPRRENPAEVSISEFPKIQSKLFEACVPLSEWLLIEHLQLSVKPLDSDRQRSIDMAVNRHQNVAVLLEPG